MPYSSAITPRALLLAVFALGAAIIVALTIGNGAGPPAANAADHLDAPDLTSPGGDPRLDINDVYAFQTRPGYTALIMTVNPASAAGDQALFAQKIPRLNKDRQAKYSFRIDNDGDAKADVVIETRARVQSKRALRLGTPNAAAFEQRSRIEACLGHDRAAARWLERSRDHLSPGRVVPRAGATA